MGMTSRQYQGFLRTIVSLIDRMLEKNPGNMELKEIRPLLEDTE